MHSNVLYLIRYFLDFTSTFHHALPLTKCQIFVQYRPIHLIIYLFIFFVFEHIKWIPIKNRQKKYKKISQSDRTVAHRYRSACPIYFCFFICFGNFILLLTFRCLSAFNIECATKNSIHKLKHQATHIHTLNR